MGHSFGSIVVSAMAQGARAAGELPWMDISDLDRTIAAFAGGGPMSLKSLTKNERVTSQTARTAPDFLRKRDGLNPESRRHDPGVQISN
jgi:hypothetical protein